MGTCLHQDSAQDWFSTWLPFQSRRSRDFVPMVGHLKKAPLVRAGFSDPEAPAMAPLRYRKGRARALKTLGGGNPPGTQPPGWLQLYPRWAPSLEALQGSKRSQCRKANRPGPGSALCTFCNPDALAAWASYKWGAGAGRAFPPGPAGLSALLGCCR